MIRRIIVPFVLILLVLYSCTVKEVKPDPSDHNKVITDSTGNSVSLPDSPRVVACFGSFAECWLLSGGQLVGVTDDAINERNLKLDESVGIIGTVKEINLESLVSYSPDYVILSADIAAHVSLRETLDSLGIKYGYFRVDTISDYANMMKSFCDFNGRDDLYNKNVEEVIAKRDEIISSVPNEASPTFLLMRSYSTGIKVKNDNIADTMLKELGGVSIADQTPSLLTDLSVEQVVKSDPDYIFVLTMGDEQAGIDFFRNNIVNDPAWSGLKAIKNGNFYILPKELFHYKPNNRWADSYLYLARILYPDVF